MDVWSPAQYRRFAAERRQPFDALQWLEWGLGTALQRVRVALPDDAAYDAHLAAYEDRVRRVLGPPDMPYLFTFERIFLWARFDAAPGA